MGVYGTCAAAKLRGRFGCRVSNISFVDAEAQCSAVGARLCTFDEINKNAARGLGCHGLYDSDSYCWVSDDASGCGPGEVLATRCRHYNAGQHQSDPAAGHTVCKKRDDVVNDAGSLVCCASGTAGEAEFRAGSKVDCSAIKCGADCTGKCGWSEPHQECRNGGKTAPREMLDGECDHVDRYSTQGVRASRSSNMLAMIVWECGRATSSSRASVLLRAMPNRAGRRST